MSKHYNRRDFLKLSTISSIAFTLPGSIAPLLTSLSAPLKIGLITDLHQDIMHDGYDRMKTFTDQVAVEKPDAIMQLGDFAYPGDKNKDVIDLFNNAHPKRFHVIGNHDTDAGYTNEQCINYWGMPARYYVEEIKGISFIFLDGNEKGSPTSQGGYASYIGEDQWTWLQQKLEEIAGPIVVVSHQPIAGPYAIDNAADIQAILAKASDKILFAMNGHTHIDLLVRVNEINYLHVNSASYLWVGGKHKHQSYSETIHRDFPWIASTCPYKDSLFSFLTIDPETLQVTIQGRQSEWVGPAPHELSGLGYPMLIFGETIVPGIKDRKILRGKG